MPDTPTPETSVSAWSGSDIESIPEFWVISAFIPKDERVGTGYWHPQSQRGQTFFPSQGAAQSALDALKVRIKDYRVEQFFPAAALAITREETLEECAKICDKETQFSRSDECKREIADLMPSFTERMVTLECDLRAHVTEIIALEIRALSPQSIQKEKQP